MNNRPNFHLITVFPEMITDALKWGVIGRAHEKGIFSFSTINPRDFTTDVHKTIDDRPFGGGDGMVMLFDPLEKSIQSIPEYKTKKKIYLTPSGRLLNEKLVNELSASTDFVLLSGRYGGVDQRFLNQYEFESVSVGDYVVSGGELPSLILMDALLRKVPGVLGNEKSSVSDSFAATPYLEAPLFTRPREHAAGSVPDVLLSGDHKKIDEFRAMIGLAITLQNRPELVQISNDELVKLRKYLAKISPEELLILGITKDL